MADRNSIQTSLSHLEKRIHGKAKNFIKSCFSRVNLQRIVGFIALIPFSYSVSFIFKFVMRYKIENMKQIRCQFREILKDKRPLIICANHLTFIDSCLIIWALAPTSWYLFNYKSFSWNLPAGDFFGKKFHFRVVAFLNKCIFIHRDASSVHHNEILDTCKDLLVKGEIVTIFPEGQRSRSGTFDPTRLTYGVSKIILAVPDCRVLCMYVRGDKQDSFSNYPLKKSSFYMTLKCITPKTNAKGREAYVKIVHQIGQTLKGQEDEYFSSHGGEAIQKYGNE